MHLMKRAGYVGGWERLNRRGMRPVSHVLADDLLVYGRNSPGSKKLFTFHKGPCFRVREVAVYPPLGSTFERGRNVISPYADGQGFQLAFAASDIPEEAFGEKHVVLSVDPGRFSNIRKIGSLYYIEPDSIAIANPIAHPVVTFGRVDREKNKSRLPLHVLQTDEAFMELKWDEVRFLTSWREGGVWPIVRAVSFMGGRRAIDISCRPDAEYTMIGEKI